MTEQGYNGWTNYETWCVHLWMSNDEHSDEYFRELAREALDKNENEEDVDPAIYDLSRSLENVYDELYSELDIEGPFADLLSAALGSVEWYEIAEHYIEAVKEEDECESST